MAESMRDIKRRIKSVNSTKQLTHALELVSSAKLRKLRQKADARREYTKYVIESMHKVASNIQNSTNIFLKENDSKKDLYIVMAADKGLAGGFNTNLFKFALEEMSSSEEYAVVTLGNKSDEFFRRRNIEILNSYCGESESPSPELAREIGRSVTDLFKKGEIGNIYVVYNRFMSVISQKPSIVKLFPLESNNLDQTYDEVDSMQVEEEIDNSVVKEELNPETAPIMVYEPSADALLDYLIPRYIVNAIYGAALENSAGEQAARRMAMENATDNADEMIEGLTLKYNRARQGAITQELTEIVNGAQALE